MSTIFFDAFDDYDTTRTNSTIFSRLERRETRKRPASLRESITIVRFSCLSTMITFTSYLTFTIPIEMILSVSMFTTRPASNINKTKEKYYTVGRCIGDRTNFVFGVKKEINFFRVISLNRLVCSPISRTGACARTHAHSPLLAFSRTREKPEIEFT